MTSRDFCYWLQGYIEITAKYGAVSSLSDSQVKCIAEHLNLVFVHEIDPSAGGPTEQAKLNAVHQGVSKEEVQQACNEVISKLPRPPIGGSGPGGVLIRC